MTNTLHKIQVMAKIAKIISAIVFIIVLVAALLCALGFIALMADLDTSWQIGGVTLYGLFQQEAGISTSALYAPFAGGLITCIGAAILARMSQRCFSYEIKAGSPFHYTVARKMMRLGIFSIILPLITALVAWIVTALINFNMGYPRPDMNFSITIQLLPGLMLIFIALICRYGAERCEEDEARRED